MRRAPATLGIRVASGTYRIAQAGFVALAAGWSVALLDPVLTAHVQGVRLESVRAFAWPTLMLLGGVFLLSLLGVAAARLFLGASEEALLSGALGGPAAAALWVLGVRTPAWAAATWKEAAFWSAAALLCGSAVFFFAEGLARRPRSRRAAARLAALSPLLLALVFLLQAWRSGHGPSTAFGAGAAVCGLALIAAARWRRERATVAALGLATAAAIALAAVSEPIPAAPAPRVAASSGEAPRRIVLITIDTLRRDALGVYSPERSTPHLDRLAADSMVFEHAYSSAPWTLSAVTGLLTGVSSWTHGVRTLGDSPAAGIPTLAERLNAVGFRTAAFAANYFLTDRSAGPTLGRGFEEYRPYPLDHRPTTAALTALGPRFRHALGRDASTDDISDAGLAWLDGYLNDDVFLWLHYFDPHAPYDPPAAYAPEGPPNPAVGRAFGEDLMRRWRAHQFLPSPGAVEWMRRLYQAETSYVDAAAGRVIDWLKQSGAYEDSMIIVTSDHGEEFYEHGGLDHGHSLFDELLLVPLLLKLPNSERAGRIERRVSTLATAPTILRFADVDFDAAEMVAGDLAGEMPEGPEAVYAAGIYRGADREAVLFDRWKLIREVDWGRTELYDLEADPEEFTNLAASRPEEVALGVALLGRQASEAAERRERLGLGEAQPITFDDNDLKLLKSLGYVQ